MGVNEENQVDDRSRYDGLCNRAFMERYFRDHGITDEEIELYASWGGFFDIGRLENDDHGMEYVRDRVASIKAYRNVTLDDLRYNYDDAPWAWPTAMRFQGIGFKVTHRDLRIGGGILLCVYGNKQYFFNVGKEEPTGALLERLIADGEWRIYTYSD